MTVSSLSFSVMTLVGTLFVGWQGATSLAAVGLGGAASFALTGFGFGAFRAGKVAVSQVMGADRSERVIPIIGSSLLLAVLVGVVTALLGALLAPFIARASSAEAAPLTEAYLVVRSLSAPALFASIALREARFGLGDSRSPMNAAVVSNLANIALDAVLVVGLGWGVVGAAWGAVLAQFVDLGLLARVQRREGLGLRLISRADLVWLWRLGWPLGVQFLMEIGAFTLLVAFLAWSGDVQVAAHQIALQAVHFSFMPAVGLGEAASVLVGRAVGANRDELVGRVARITALLNAAYSALCGVVFATLGGFIASGFTSDPVVIETARKLLLVAAAFVVVDGLNITARCALRGTGDVRFPALVGILTAWLCLPPMTALFAFHFGLGALGGWLAISLDVLLGALLLWWRLEGQYWRAAAARSRLEAQAGANAPSPEGSSLEDEERTSAVAT
jgi:MATE family multidrug resistance protein